MWEILQEFQDLGFVLKIMSFSYLTYWLYMTFYNSKILFGIMLALAGFFAITYSGATTALVIIFAVLFVIGPQLQNTIWFGLGPLLSPLGIDLQGGKVNQKLGELEHEKKIEEIERKVASGNATQEEIQFYQQIQMQNMQSMQQEQDMTDNMANYDAMNKKAALLRKR